MIRYKRQNRHTEISAKANENRVGSVVTVKLKISVSHEEESVAKEHERHMIKYVQPGVSIAKIAGSVPLASRGDYLLED